MNTDATNGCGRVFGGGVKDGLAFEVRCAANDLCHVCRWNAKQAAPAPEAFAPVEHLHADDSAPPARDTTQF
jgi:hypothetical protein